MLNADYIQALSLQFSINAEQFILYDQHRDPIQKQFICQYWLRGTCCFTPDFCHFAHGIQYLEYKIDSITNLKPLPSLEDVKLKYRIDGFPKQYFVVEKFQSHPKVKEELKEYHEYIGKYYDPNKVYTLREIKFERSIKPIILNTMYLLEIQSFYEKILEMLQVKIIPRAVFIHELNRVGYSFMGSHFARPKTLIFHLQNSGSCFSKTLRTNIVITGYDESILRKQNSLKVLKQGVAKQNIEQNDNQDDVNKEDNDDQDEEEEDEMMGLDDPIETKEGEKEIIFLIKVDDKKELIKSFALKLQEILTAQPELAKLTDMDDFQLAIDERIKEENHINFQKQQQIFPNLHQILTIKNQIWDEFAEEHGFQHIKFTNSRDSGIPISSIVKYFTPEQKLELTNYLQKPKIKYFLCQYWMRGICIFQKKDCRFAHGLEDLELNFDIARDFEHLNQEQKPLRYNQKPLINHRTYQILFLQQYKMIDYGVLGQHQKKNIFQIDNLKEYRDKIREFIQREMIINLYKRISNGKPQNKGEIMKYYNLVGFIQRGIDLSELKIIKLLINNDAVFEKESIVKVHQIEQDGLSKKEKKKVTQKQILLIPVLDYNVYNKFYESIIFQALISVLKNKVELPVEESVVKKEIYKLDQVLEMPGLYQFFLRHPKKKYTLIDYFQENILGQVKNKLKDQIHPEVYEQISEDGFNLISFEADIPQLMAIIQAIYGNVLSHNQIPINFDKLIKQIEMKASDNDKYNCLVNYLHKDKLHKFFSINGSLYVINQHGKIVDKIKKCKCGKQYQAPAKIKQINNNMLIQKIMEVQEFIDKDVRNTIIVDSAEKLLLVQDFMSFDVNYIGIDLEGQLRKGDIWLVQMGVMIENLRIIFIFDLMKSKYLEADLVFHEQMISVIRLILEDEGICKVFHDCKRDSQALHINHICPKNIADTSSTYIFLESLKLNDQEQKKVKKNPIQISKEVLQVATPPINSVLTKYGALYGGNELKEEMHAKFNNCKADDFFARPNPAFMYYSARDVEDLVQVYLQMEMLALDYRYIIEKMSNKNKEYFLKGQDKIQDK
ncbi:unnamed protein product [Paramecium octaurelia]|uniref:C3H1-type domain-containing protein n=1 Tax=Paramecium octaurelia TaxID=43137 RepID=A0A8S1S544_PAROT|nr:unnamed protein product [Paramecium octaurelia]